MGGEEKLEIVVEEPSDEAVETVRSVEGVSQVTRDEETLVVSCTDDAKTRVIGALEDSGVTVRDFHTREASLEDLFLAYTEGDAATGGNADPAATASEGSSADADDAGTAAEEVDR